MSTNKYILTSTGHLYTAVPKMKPVKDKKGNRSEVQDGWQSSGIPHARFTVFFADRHNPILDHVLKTLDVVVES